MTGDPSDDLQALWRAQPSEHEPMTLAEIHQRARTMQRKVRRRNLTEYVAGVLVILAFAPVLLHKASWMMQGGAALIIVATVMVLRHMHRMASARAVPEGGAPIIDFHREELIRQRDALRTVGRWYLAPFVPGLALIIAGRWLQAHTRGRSIETDHLIILVISAVMVLIFVLVWALNRWGAKRLQKRIDELDAL
jgi:hypothetical protein